MLAQLPVPLHPHADTGTAKTDPGEAADTPTDMGGTPIQSFPTEGSTFLTEIIPPKRRITPLRDIPPSKFPSKCKGADSPRHASFQLGGAAGSRLSKTPDLFHVSLNGDKMRTAMKDDRRYHDLTRAIRKHCHKLANPTIAQEQRLLKLGHSIIAMH
ncbi:hypothetical protein DPSP01_012135 [Paraphaeosphaeria sporulosa]